MQQRVDQVLPPGKMYTLIFFFPHNIFCMKAALQRSSHAVTMRPIFS